MVRGDAKAAGQLAGFAALYLLAGAAGRASIIDREPTALVWPAAGLAVVWLVTRPSPRVLAVDIPLVFALGAAAALIAGVEPGTTVILAVSNLVAVLGVVTAMQWWCPATARDGVPPSETPQALFGFLAAAAVGCLAGVVVGLAGLVGAGHDVDPGGPLVWWGRNVCGMLAVGTTATLIVDRMRHGRRNLATSSGRAELAALFVATAALVLIDHGTLVPVTFLLPATAVWAGSRFSQLAVAGHALTGGAGVLWLTSVGHGPFADVGGERTEIALAQLFVAMTLLIGLVLAAAREAGAALQADLLAKEREQTEELLTFARRVAHDVRNPIAVIEAWTAELSSVLDTGPAGPPPGTTTMIGGIERAATRMRSLVDHLLEDASHPDRLPAPSVVDLATMVAEVAHEYGAHAVDTAAAGPVAGDPVLLRQLVDNLVGNAIKYVRPGEEPAITVTTADEGDRVVVRLADRGVGIPAGSDEWIFEPFRRAHGTAYPGSGLGLSTCRRIVERHGGSIRAIPRDDGPGSVFVLDLPHPRTVPPRPVLVGAETGDHR
jgi:signal transduction histidine kinase